MGVPKFITRRAKWLKLSFRDLKELPPFPSPIEFFKSENISPTFKTLVYMYLEQGAGNYLVITYPRFKKARKELIEAGYIPKNTTLSYAGLIHALHKFNAVKMPNFITVTNVYLIPKDKEPLTTLISKISLSEYIRYKAIKQQANQVVKEIKKKV